MSDTGRDRRTQSKEQIYEYLCAQFPHGFVLAAIDRETRVATTACYWWRGGQHQSLGLVEILRKRILAMDDAPVGREG